MWFNGNAFVQSTSHLNFFLCKCGIKKQKNIQYSATHSLEILTEYLLFIIQQNIDLGAFLLAVHLAISGLIFVTPLL